MPQTIDARRSNPAPASDYPKSVPGGPEPSYPPKEAAAILRVSVSWLAKSRMRGDGPAYFKYGRMVRYGQSALVEYARSRQRRSTSEK